MARTSTSQPRVVVITGASSGIGRAAALRFGARGDRLVLVARREEELRRTLRLAGGFGRVFVADVGVRAEVEALAASVAELEGACDVLVNNAGIGSTVAFEGREGLDELERVMAVNFFAAAWATSELLPLLRRAPRPAIVNVSSVAGLIASANSTVYSASKFALTGYSESMHARLAPEGIHVANVQPGPVVTEGWPHPWARASVLRRLLLADVGAVARCIERCADRRGTPTPVIRRWYRWLMFFKFGAPPLYRAGLERTDARRSSWSGTTGGVTKETST